MGARLVGTYYTDAYVADDGRDKVLVKAKLMMPSDITQVVFGSIVSAAGFTPLKYGDDVINDDPGSICPEGANLKPRELVFYRQNGNSISVKIADKKDLITAGNAIKAALDGIDGTNKVVCVKLKGEVWKNIWEELGGTGARVAAPTPPRTSKKQAIYSPRIKYKSEPSGTEIIIPVKINSDKVNDIPTTFSSIWGGCAGAAVTVNSCGGRDWRNHRRYIPTVLTTIGSKETSYLAEIPVASNVPAEIKACGTAIAALTSVYCLAYKGEDNSRFHKLLT